MLTSRRAKAAVALVLATVIAGSACGRDSDANGAERGYAVRIAELRRESVLDLSFGEARQTDSGASTTCEDPEFSHRTPAVFRDYRYTGDRAAAVSWLQSHIATAGWTPLADEQPTAGGRVTIVNFLKTFGDWRSKLLLSVQDHVYQILLQADERSDCPDV